MDVADSLLTLFTAQIEERTGDYVIRIPEQEVSLGTLESGGTYRVGLIPPVEQRQETGRAESSRSAPQAGRDGEREGESPPVEEGDQREVEIEDVGEQGDGIARIGPGYIVFVPDTHVGDRVTIEITDVRANFAFGDVVAGPY